MDLAYLQTGISGVFYWVSNFENSILQLRYCGRDSIIQVRIDLIFIMVPLGEQKQMEQAQTYKTSCRYVTYSKYGVRNIWQVWKAQF